jgi:FKBP-type peptidyl-prolyl cis-trans isomerase 2
MIKIKKDSFIVISYVAKLDDGIIFDTSPHFQFVYGDQNVLPELQEVVVDMELGSTKTLTLSPINAYGKYNNELVIPIPKESLPNDFSIKIGDDYIYHTEHDELKKARILREDESYIYFDHNHPLAGKTLQYEITLLEIK